MAQGIGGVCVGVGSSVGTGEGVGLAASVGIEVLVAEGSDSVGVRGVAGVLHPPISMEQTAKMAMR